MHYHALVMAAEALPFFILMQGRFAADRVRVIHDPRARPTTPQLDALIETEWLPRLAEAQREHRLLFNGELLRYVGHRIIEGPQGAVNQKSQFELSVGPTCYRDFVGTNLYNNRRVAEFGWKSFSNPVGTTATLLTADGRICYGRRSMQVAFHAGYVHTFGGALEPGDRDAAGDIDVFDSVRRELHEEVGLLPHELESLICVGLIRDTEILQPELLFEATVPLTTADLIERWSKAEARDEHHELVDLPDDADAIMPFIRGCGKIAAVAVGALMLHGLHRWGQDWYDHAADELTR